MTSERLGNLPIRDLQRRMAEQPARADLGPNPSWEQILAADPDHEKLLDTSEGRFQAAINIIKNGAMVLEIAQLHENQWQGYRQINNRLNSVSGIRVCTEFSTRDHLIVTTSVVGAAARSDIEDKNWRRTAFGTALLPAAVSVWGQILEDNIDPAKALSSASYVKKDADGNIIDSTPYSRARILTNLFHQGETKEVTLARQRNLRPAAINAHLQRLKEVGFVNLESVDVVAPYTYFGISAKGLAHSNWPTYQGSLGRSYVRLTQEVDLAITAQVIEGKETFTSTDISNWISRNYPDASASSKSRATVSSCLSFFVAQGLLQRSRMNKANMSEVTLTERGYAFVEHVLFPLESWAENPNSVAKINEARERLRINPDSFNGLFRDVARVYVETSPAKNNNAAVRAAEILRLIQQSPDVLTASIIARRLGVSGPAVANHLKTFIEEGGIVIRAGEGTRKYLSMAGQDGSDQSVDNQERN